MSRTIRRKNAYDKRTAWGLYTTYEKVDGIWQDVPKDPKTLVRDLALYHSDKEQHSGPNKWFRSEEHNKLKSLAKGELARFWKNPEYEIQIERRRKHDYWD